MSDDIGPILKEWDEDPESKGIRKINGFDNKEKIQIRVEFGLLQLEADGRPDGKRPYGKESLLEHYLSLIEDCKKYGSDEDFKLDYHDCEKLREEAMQYYQRYVSCFHLEDYPRAARDTARNLRVFDLVKKYAEQQDDALSLEQYRPYVIMMNTRARAFIRMDNDDFIGAVKIIEAAMETIVEFYKQNEYDESQIIENQELEVLRATLKEVRNRWEGVNA